MRLRQFIKFELWDAKIIYLWHDIWHPDEILFMKYGFRVIYDASSRPEAKVDSVLKNKTWVWKPARSEDLVTIQSQL
jgi:hypothetical protein